MVSHLRAFAGVVTLALVAVAAHPVAQSQSTFGQGAFRPGSGIHPPQVVKQFEPKYTPDALRRQVEGDVELEVVVGVDGAVGDVRVVRSLEPELDAQAVAAAKQWQFRPGTNLYGNAVPVIVTLVLSFRMGTTAIGDQAPFAARAAAEEAFAQGACRPTGGNTLPKIRSQVQPKYTREAMQAKIEGAVTLEAVVNPDGTVARTRVTQSLDSRFGLDQQAQRAASQWTFEPNSGLCHGVPAPFVVTIVLSFRLHSL